MEGIKTETILGNELPDFHLDPRRALAKLRHRNYLVILSKILILG